MEENKPFLSRWDKEMLGGVISGMALVTGIYLIFDYQSIFGEYNWIVGLGYIISGFYITRLISNSHYKQQ